MIQNPSFDTYITNVLVLIVVKFKSNVLFDRTQTTTNQYTHHKKQIRNERGAFLWSTTIVIVA